MKIHLIIVQYNKVKNAVSEHRIKTVHSIEEAEIWLNNIFKPAMFYIDGMQNHDRFLDLCCLYNSEYWIEYKKIID